MDLSGRRESKNVVDRRGSTGTKVGAGIGCGGIILIIIISLLTGNNPMELLQRIGSQQQSQGQTTTHVSSPEEDSLAVFTKKILAGTEDIWTEEFRKIGKTYQPPKLVLFTNSVQSGCGNATSSVGPFYCSADQTVYIDLSFFMNMKKQIGADGDFAYAYVIAHEVGHHVQNQLGILNAAHQKMAQVSKTESNKISVCLELQADYFAGVWAHHDNNRFKSLEDGDIEEGLNVASKIGDDYLQKQAYGYTVPESFNHGTSAQRARWLKKGLTTGDINGGDTFSVGYNNL
ncbi:MAG: neutral zinc metallopeptidase [Bacteroidales bacterium]|nr:neutral zinc metallopeptidase [Bacteroidales bacterium]MBO7646549.1 neutral zinc metallopeptidase [Bacteroidales bacterium]